MDKKLELKIVSPEKVVYHDHVDSVSMPTMDGEITVMYAHLPVITALKAGELTIRKDGKEDYFSVTRGVAEIDGHTITILTDAAERAEEIDEKRAEEARKKAKEVMASKKTEEEYTDAVAQMERAISRLKIAKKRRGGHSPHIEQ